MRVHQVRTRLTASQKRELARIEQAESRAPRNRLERELDRLRSSKEEKA